MPNNAYLPLAKLTLSQRNAAETGILVTASDRLRREYTYAYDHARMSAGEVAWQEPSITSYDALLRRDYERVRATAPDSPVLLTAIAQHALFRSVAPDNLQHLTGIFEDAWQIIHAWQIDDQSPAFFASINTRCFAQWANNVRKALDEAGAITNAQLASLDYPVQLEGVIHLTGFDLVTAQQQQWLQRAKEAGATIRFDDASRPGSPKGLRTGQRFLSEVAELTAAICWARERLEAAPQDQPPPRIAIVVPDLLKQHATVARLLHAHLEGNQERTEALYNIGGGLALAQHPLIESALALLASIHEPSHYTAIERLLADPALPGIASHNRLPPECAEFLRLAELPPGCGPEPLRTIIRQTTDWADNPAPQRTVQDWWRAAASVLRNAQWHRARKDSEGFQATSALLDVLITQAPDAAALMRWSDAYALLVSVADQTLFAPASTPAPVQVLGYLEAIELEFDHLWITGMSANAWPTPVTNNPFLPAAELARVQVPRTTHASELAFAQRWLNRVTSQPTECRASFVGEDLPAQEESSSTADQTPLEGISPLLADWPAHPTKKDGSDFHPLLTYWSDPSVRSAVALQKRADITGSRPSPGDLHRATRRLENQATCPMRGWAIHTLDLDAPVAPHSLPNALERGNLLHHALLQVFQKIRSSDDLRLLDAPARKALCERVAAQRVESELGRYAEAVRRIEFERLSLSLQRFLQLESTRGSFFLNRTEQEIKGQLGPWKVTLQIDRIDDVPGGQVVIDYKSTSPTLTKLLDERLSAPQLPLYVLFILSQGKPLSDINFEDPIVQAGAFAELRPDSSRYVGLRSADEETGMPPDLDHKQDWRQVLRAWRERLEVLGKELEQGLAIPDPTVGSCERCDLHSLCRYHLNHD